MAYTMKQYEIPSGDRGTRRTLEVMQQLVIAASMNPDVRDMAAKIMRPDKLKPSLSIYVLRDWLRVVMRFVRDPGTAEALTDPVALVQRIAANGFAIGDCDDVALLAAAMALSVGFRVRFVVVGFHGTAPLAGGLDSADPFLHIWAEVAPPTGTLVWTEMDTTRPMQRVPMDELSRVWIVPIPREG